MTLIRKGQKVKLTPKPSAKFSGEVVGILKADYNNGPGHFSVFELEDALTTFNGNAWDVEVVNELPTEPGVYVPTDNSNMPHISYIYKLRATGTWRLEHEPHLSDEDAYASALSAFNRNGGLTRLVPEA